MDSLAVQNIVDRILTPRPAAVVPAVPPAPEPETPEDELYIPSYAQPDYQEPQPVLQPEPNAAIQSESFDFNFEDDGRSENDAFFAEPAPANEVQPASMRNVLPAAPSLQVRRKRGFSRRQWLLLGGMGVIEMVILIIMFIMIAKSLF
jgi:hypothetical protein